MLKNVRGLFKDYDFHLVESLDTSLIEMNALFIDSHMPEAAISFSERYPPRTVYGITAGLRRFLAEKKPGTLY